MLNIASLKRFKTIMSVGPWVTDKTDDDYTVTDNGDFNICIFGSYGSQGGGHQELDVFENAAYNSEVIAKLPDIIDYAIALSNTNLILVEKMRELVDITVSLRSDIELINQQRDTSVGMDVDGSLGKELETIQAFYKLAISQRNNAWAENKMLEELLETYSPKMMSSRIM